jgi:hypothetical protein
LITHTHTHRERERERLHKGPHKVIREPNYIKVLIRGPNYKKALSTTKGMKEPPPGVAEASRTLTPGGGRSQGIN